jgi:hypothetical protein
MIPTELPVPLDVSIPNNDVYMYMPELDCSEEQS